jgi:hypothetical protein
MTKKPLGLGEDKSHHVVKTFKTKEQATKGGVLEKAVGPAGVPSKSKSRTESFKKSEHILVRKIPRNHLDRSAPNRILRCQALGCNGKTGDCIIHIARKLASPFLIGGVSMEPPNSLRYNELYCTAASKCLIDISAMSMIMMNISWVTGHAAFVHSQY